MIQLTLAGPLERAKGRRKSGQKRASPRVLDGGSSPPASADIRERASPLPVRPRRWARTAFRAIPEQSAAQQRSAALAENRAQQRQIDRAALLALHAANEERKIAEAAARRRNAEPPLAAAELAHAADPENTS